MSNSSSVSSYIRNFPFTTLRENQGYILNEIDSAFSSGYKYIILEAPTGTGKSPIAIATGLSLGTSYICVSTKDLQTQYSKDFSFLREAIGKNNFVCNVREDHIKNGTFKCTLCLSPIGTLGQVSSQIKTCYHMSVDYAPCISDASFQRGNCRHRTFEKWSYPKDSKLKKRLRTCFLKTS